MEKLKKIIVEALRKPINTGIREYADKKTINLLSADFEVDPKKRILIFILVACVAVLVLKFMIFDRIWSGYEAQRDYTVLKTQIAELKVVTGDYERVRAEYSHYGNGYTNEEEAKEQDRAVIMRVISSDILSKADIQSLQISVNTAMISIDNIRLGTISAIVAALESEQSVSYVNVSTAGTNTSNADSSVQATLNITFNEGGKN